MVLPNIYGTNLILKDFKLSFIIIIKRIIELVFLIRSQDNISPISYSVISIISFSPSIPKPYNSTIIVQITLLEPPE